MSAIPVSRAVSPEEYLRAEREAEFKSEYIGGRIVGMAGASRVHNRILANLARILGNQLLDRPCRLYVADQRVSVRDGQSYLYPDLVVVNGRPIASPTDRDSLNNPTLVIEILSPSTEGRDRGEKFLEYQTIPSLREYVLVSQSPRRFEVYRRQEDGSWRYESWAFAPPTLALQSVDCALAAEEVYLGVELEEDAGGET